MDKRIWKPLAMTLAVSAASVSQAYADVDIDNDGLIEISTLQQLDLMRYDLAGASLNGDSTGCPATGCNGYELTTDLDFDTNGNGVADAGDLFWNGGEGWEPLVGEFTAAFNGNGYSIKNFFLGNVTGSGSALISNAKDTEITDVSFENVKISGSASSEDVAVVVSSANGVTFSDISILGLDVDAPISNFGTLSSNSVNVVSASNLHVEGNIKVDRTVGPVFGFVKGVSENAPAELSNISYEGVTEANEEVAGLVNAMLYVDLEDCSVSGSLISHGHDNGGVTSHAQSSSIARCHVSADIDVNSDAQWGVYAWFSGGLVGEFYTGQIEQSSYTGNITSIGRGVGGAIGFGVGNLDLINLRIEGSLSADECCVAGLVGGLASHQNHPSELVRIHDTLILASINGSTAGTLTGANWLSVAQAEDVVEVSETYWNIDISTVVQPDGQGAVLGGEGKTTFELQCPTMPGDVNCDASMYSDWDDTIWDFGTSTEYPVLILDADRDGVKDSEDIDDDNDGLIEISTLQELDLMRYDLAGASLNGDSTGCPATGCNGYELTTDLDFDTNGNGVADAGDLFWNGGEGWEPLVGEFTAAFNGNGYSIKNFFLGNVTGSGSALISNAKDTEITDVSFENVKISGSASSEDVAVVVSSANGVTFSDISILGLDVDAPISNFGTLSSNSVNVVSASNLHVEGNIKVDRTVGPVFGFVKGVSENAPAELSNISYEGVTEANEEVAGLVNAMLYVDLEDCSVSGSLISHGHDNGGVTSHAQSSSIARCHVSADIDVNSDAQWGVYAWFSGGLVGEFYTGQIEQSSYTGNITSIGRGVGGAIGFGVGNLDLINLRIEGSLSADECCVAGLVGGLASHQNHPSELVRIHDTLILASINGSTAGTLTGANWLSVAQAEDVVEVSETYWNIDISTVVQPDGQGAVLGGEGKTTFELQCPTMPGDVNCDASMYSDWDDTIWDFGTSYDYPVLR